MSRGYCRCSAYGFEDLDERIAKKVRLYECVRERGGGLPCYYMVMPERYWDGKEHRIMSMIYRLAWILKHWRLYRTGHDGGDIDG